MEENTENKIQLRNVKDLVLLESNPRSITKKQMEVLKKSIKENMNYFHARPILLSNRTGKLVVIGGNQRLRASIELKMKEVPTFLFEGITKEKERELIIRDNVSNGEWDFDELANKWDIEELNDWGLELPAFPTNEIDLNLEDEDEGSKGKGIKIEITFHNEEDRNNLFHELEERKYICRIL